MHVYVVVSLLTGACSEERRALTWSHLDPEGDASGFPQWMTALPRAAAASTISSDCRSGEPFLVVLIISVVTTAVAGDDKRVWSTMGRPRRCHERSGSFPAWSRLCRGLGRRGLDRGLLRVDAEVEVRGESVPQILGGEIIQRCPGHGSSDRADIVSLIIDSLHQQPCTTCRRRWRC